MSKYDELRKKLGISTSSANQTGGSKYDNLRMDLGIIPETRPERLQARKEANDTAESMINIAKAPDMLKQQNEDRKVSQAADVANSSIMNLSTGTLPKIAPKVSRTEKVLRTAGNAALQGAILGPLNDIGQQIEKFERFTGLNKVGGAMKGLVNPEFTHKNPYPDDGTYLGAYKSAAGAGIAGLRNLGSSAIEGYKNTDQTKERFDKTTNDIAKTVFDPVSGTAFKFAAGAGTDPLSFLPFERIGSVAKEGVGAATGLVRKATEAPLPTYEGISLTNTRKLPEAAETMKGNWFTNLFGDQGVGISAVGSNKRISQGPLTTADQIVNKSIKTDVQGVKDEAAAKLRATYQNFVDRLDPLKRVSERTYETAMDASRANNIANTIVRDKFVTPEGVVVGEGLANTFKKVARGSDRDFIDYLTLRHAPTRMERGERVYAENLNMTPEKVADRLDMYNKRHPEFANIAKEWDQFWHNMRYEYGVKSGLASEAQIAAMEAKNPFYSPMNRQFSKSEKPGKKFLAKSTGSAFSGQKLPINKVSPTGSVRNIVDPRKTAIESAGAWVNAAMRNRVMQSMVDTVKRDPNAYKGVVEIVAKPKGMNDLREVLTNGGEDDFLEALNADFANIFKTSRVDGDNIVRAMVNGEPVYMKVHDPELVKTLVGMGPQASNALIDVMSTFSNATKRGATGLLAPVFAVKGATMDLVQSAIQAKNPAKQAAYTVYSIFSGIGDRLNIPGLKNLAEEYRRAGGEYSAALKGDRRLNRGISDMARYPLLSPQGIAKGAGKLVTAPFRALESVGNIAENAPRMAAYKQEMQRLGNARTPENVRRAMSAGREATVNFSRKGALSRDLESFIPYNNAAVQGTYRIMKGMKDHPVRTVAAIGAISVLPKMIEYMQFADDPDYQNLPARERYRFLIVNKNADGTFTKIPMDPAYNSFGEIAIEALRRFKDNDPTAFKGAADALANAWSPPLVTGVLQGVTQDSGLTGSIAGALNSTVAAPFVAVTANKSFTGAPIVPQSVADRSPQYQYDERTSSIAKQLGGALNMSPMQVDYLIRAYGGDAARLALPLTSQVGRGNVRNTLLKNFIVDPAFSTTLTNDFYDAKDKLNRAYRDNEEMGVPLPSWYSEDLRKELTSTAKGSISKRVSLLNDQKDAVNADKSLTPQQRTDKLRDLQQQINQIYVDVNSRVNQAGVLR